MRRIFNPVLILLITALGSPGSVQAQKGCPCPSIMHVDVEIRPAKLDGTSWDVNPVAFGVGASSRVSYPDLALALRPVLSNCSGAAGESCESICPNMAQIVTLPRETERQYQDNLDESFHGYACSLASTETPPFFFFCRDSLHVLFPNVPIPTSPFLVSIVDVDWRLDDLVFEHRGFPHFSNIVQDGSKNEYISDSAPCEFPKPDRDGKTVCDLTLPHGTIGRITLIPGDDALTHYRNEQPSKTIEYIASQLLTVRMTRLEVSYFEPGPLETKEEIQNRLIAFLANYQARAAAVTASCAFLDLYRIADQALYTVGPLGFGSQLMADRWKEATDAFAQAQLASESEEKAADTGAEQAAQLAGMTVRDALTQLIATLWKDSAREHTWQRILTMYPDLFPWAKQQTFEEASTFVELHADELALRIARMSVGEIVALYFLVDVLKNAIEIGEDLAKGYQELRQGCSSDWQSARSEFVSRLATDVGRRMVAMGFPDSPAWAQYVKQRADEYQQAFGVCRFF